MSFIGETGLFLMLIYLLVFGSPRIEAIEGISPEAVDLERQLKILNKPFVNSIKDDYGNIYDCVDIYKQPAFDHPLLKNQKIQIPNITFVEKLVSKLSTKEKPTSFGFKENCPAGTVLIRRTTVEDLIRDRKNVQNFDAKAETSYERGLQKAYLVMRHIKYYGARAEIEVYSHQISNNQVSAAQVIISKGGNELNFGWRIDPEETRDSLTHFFISWTSDGNNKTGCFDLLCPGFVQLSQRTTPGMVLPDKSEIKLNAYKEPNNGNWVLVREDNGYELIGYWPKEIFNNFADCDTVHMGGVVYSPIDEPSPPMGNGVIPYQLFRSGAKYRHVNLLRENGDPEQPSEANSYYNYDQKVAEYYKVGRARFVNGIYEFQYGGPGGWTGK